MERRRYRDEPWTRLDVAMLGIVLFAAGALRLVLLPTRGFADDIDQFIGWVHHIAANGLANAYDENLTFGPVMAYIWALLATIDPAFASGPNPSDPAISAIMKLPASVADIGLGLLVAYGLRDRPRWALAGAAIVLLHPAVIDVSAWWGQYESIFVLPAMAGVLFTIAGRHQWAAAAITVAIMTKPQAIALLLPFAAWFWATAGWRGIVRAAAIGTSVTFVLWLPFVAAGGPLNYLRNIGEYQGEIFNILSLRAWNVWWLVQEATAGGAFIRDDITILGPLSLRHVGYSLAGLLDLAIAAAIIRRPTSRTLILGLTASVLVFFSFATQMHERYAYGALVFLALLVPEPAARGLSVAFGIVFTLNLLAAIPPAPEIGALLPVSGVLGVGGSITFLAITYAVLRMMAVGPPDLDAAPLSQGPSP